MARKGTRRGWRGSASALAAVLFSLLAAPVAGAAPPVLLTQIPEGSITPGGDAGQLEGSRALAADPGNGHLFVADNNNSRVSEFTAWGEFVKAWGWGVSDGTAILQVCTQATGCQKGIAGSGVGQLATLNGVAVDGAGNVYVFERENRRVSKFSSAGVFLLMFGREVNKGPVHPGDVCTAQHLVEGDTCGAGTAAAGNSQLSNAIGDYIAYRSGTNSILVGGVGRIQEFNLDGSFKGKIDFAGDLGEFDGGTVGALDVDGADNVYFALSGEENARKLSPLGDLVGPTFPVANPRALAVDVDGTVWVIEGPGALAGEEVLGFDAAGDQIVPTEKEMENGEPFAASEFGADLLGIAANHCVGSEAPGNLYVARSALIGASVRSYVSAYGTPPAGCEDPPERPPEIVAQFAASVDTDAAVLRARINPKFWANTTYYVQYGTAICSLGSCLDRPAAPGSLLTGKVVNVPVTSAGVFLAGLSPDTTYRYRFIAQSGGGGPVVGVGGKPSEPGAEGAFTTFPLPAPPPAFDPCSNAEFRTGVGALLPNCRAYEMVSPLDKNNTDILTALIPSSDQIPARLQQSSESGDRLTYSSSTAFGDPESAPFSSQYLAERHPLGHPEEGWLSEAISPPRTTKVAINVIDTEYKTFSPDLCTGWLRSAYEPLLGPQAVAGYPNLYRRGNCSPGKGVYDGLTPAKPGVPSDDDYLTALDLQGVSVDGARAFYVAPDNLPGSGAPANNNLRPQLYVHVSGEQPRFACILPTGSPSAQACYAGTRSDVVGNRHSSLHNAVSENASRVFWTASSTKSGPGRIFVRDHAEQGVVVGECTEASKPCTIAVSPVGNEARFWGAAVDGSVAIFVIEDGPLAGDLTSFHVASETSTPIAGDVLGVLGTSRDASHVYFASREALAGQNSNKDKAEPGEPNVYLYEEGEGTSFIGTLAAGDVSGLFSPISKPPFNHTARVTPGGRHAAFTSMASLTGYDNVDANSGEPDTEVFLYEADAARLRCVSCNPSGARPAGRELNKAGKGRIWVAAQIPGFESSVYAPRVLSDDGERLFFESHEALVVGDTNGAQDVYQWEAIGSGSCLSNESPTFSDSAGGCVDLISSGESPRASTFVDADPSGENVFFATLSSLVPQDYGLVDIYDARVRGGFPTPVGNAECEGEACQSPPPAPTAPTPASSAFRGKGNPARSRRCGDGKRRVVRKGKPRCVKKRKPPRKRARGRRGSRR